MRLPADLTCDLLDLRCVEGRGAELVQLTLCQHVYARGLLRHVRHLVRRQHLPGSLLPVCLAVPCSAELWQVLSTRGGRPSVC